MQSRFGIASTQRWRRLAAGLVIGATAVGAGVLVVGGPVGARQSGARSDELSLAPLAPLRADLRAVARGFDRPIAIANAADGTGRVFVAERRGTVRVVGRTGRVSAKPFIDLRKQVAGVAPRASKALGEAGDGRGLLGLAFHPRFRNNGLVFVSYTDGEGDLRIARLKASNTPVSAAPAVETGSQRVILEIPGRPIAAGPRPGSERRVDVARAAERNGGQLAFGPDGRLYVGVGDSGGLGDAAGAAQNPRLLRGKILRLDVDSIREASGRQGPRRPALPVQTTRPPVAQQPAGPRQPVVTGKPVELRKPGVMENPAEERPALLDGLAEVEQPAVVGQPALEAKPSVAVGPVKVAKPGNPRKPVRAATSASAATSAGGATSATVEAAPALPRPEIYALGLRNPRGLSFDRVGGHLWVADAGERHRQEVNRVRAGNSGRNLGWDCREGAVDVSRRHGRPYCATAQFSGPVWNYSLFGDRCSVVGGSVYRGTRLGRHFHGRYVYADHCSGEIWALGDQVGRGYTPVQVGSHRQITAFGEDEAGELLATTADGRLHRLLPPSAAPLPPPVSVPPLPALPAPTAALPPVNTITLPTAGSPAAPAQAPATTRSFAPPSTFTLKTVAPPVRVTGPGKPPTPPSPSSTTKPSGEIPPR